MTALLVLKDQHYFSTNSIVDQLKGHDAEAGCRDSTLRAYNNHSISSPSWRRFKRKLHSTKLAVLTFMPLCRRYPRWLSPSGWQNMQPMQTRQTPLQAFPLLTRQHHTFENTTLTPVATLSLSTFLWTSEIIQKHCCCSVNSFWLSLFPLESTAFHLWFTSKRAAELIQSLGFTWKLREITSPRRSRTRAWLRRSHLPKEWNLMRKHNSLRKCIKHCIVKEALRHACTNIGTFESHAVFKHRIGSQHSALSNSGSSVGDGCFPIL